MSTTSVEVRTFSLRDLEMLRNAVFQRAADAAKECVEDRWLELDAKLYRLQVELGQLACRCGHARRSHRHRTELTSTCTICQCRAFTLS
ncbi:MAG: hypothetical protein ACTH0V_00345 [Microbacteriaceae bacterium]